MKVPIRYAYEFGKCDISDWIETEVNLTEAESAAYLYAVINNIPLEDAAGLEDALIRAEDAIEEENPTDDGIRLIVQFGDPE